MKKYYIGCDLGGTNLRAGLVNIESGEISNLTSVDTLAREGHDAVMVRMVELFRHVLDATGIGIDQLGGIGIGVPGVLDLEKGETLFLPNLPGTWPHVPLRDTISQVMGVPVALLNDARSITYGEWRFGAGRGVDTMACFTLGTGVGGGLVINNRLHLNLGGTAGELGHQTIEPNGLMCGCGNRGCLEAYASASALTTLAFKAVTQGLTTIIGKMVDYDLNQINPKLVYQAALQGDEIAIGIFKEIGYRLGLAIGNIIVSVGPRKVVIAGGVAKAGEFILEPIRQTLKERVYVTRMDEVEIVQAQLGNNSGVMGVAMYTAETAG